MRAPSVKVLNSGHLLLENNQHILFSTEMAAQSDRNLSLFIVNFKVKD